MVSHSVTSISLAILMCVYWEVYVCLLGSFTIVYNWYRMRLRREGDARVMRQCLMRNRAEHATVAA